MCFCISTFFTISTGGQLQNMAFTQSQTQYIETYQQQAEQFWQAEVTALYQAEAGLTDAYPLAEIYTQYDLQKKRFVAL